MSIRIYNRKTLFRHENRVFLLAVSWIRPHCLSAFK